MGPRKAAERFGVSISSAIRWTSRARRLGSVPPEPQGVDTRWARIEAFAHVILGAVQETPDVTLVGLRALMAEQGRFLRGVDDLEVLFAQQDQL